MNNQMKNRMPAFLLAVLFCLCAAGSALAAKEVALPDSRYTITVPDWMRYDGPDEDDGCVFAYVSDALEMDVFSYEDEDSSLQNIAQKLAEENPDYVVELRSICGLSMVCYQADDRNMISGGEITPCVGFLLRDGKRLIEIVFWYPTEDSFHQAEEIINSIH